MKLSIVTAILNSHEIVRRQVLHYQKMDLPDDVEVVFVDDGSTPLLFGRPKKGTFSNWTKWKGIDLNFALRAGATYDKRQWTQPAARNYGVDNAQGELLLLTDIDHIVPRASIEAAIKCPPNTVIRFKRFLGALDENGEFTQDREVLKSYGTLDKYLETLRVGAHTNSFIIHKELYLSLGGVSESLVGTGRYPNREEQPLKRRLRRLSESGKIEIIDDDRRPLIYIIPNGRFCGDKNANPFGYFHGLDRERWWEKLGFSHPKEARNAI